MSNNINNNNSSTLSLSSPANKLDESFTMIYNPNQTLSSLSKRGYFLNTNYNRSLKDNTSINQSTSNNSLKIQPRHQRQNLSSSLSSGSLNLKNAGLFSLRIPKEINASQLKSTIDTRRAESIFSTTQMSFIAAPEIRSPSSNPEKPTASSLRFTPFSTILTKNASWVDFAKKNPEQTGVRQMMSNQLTFNQTQRNNLIQNASKEYNMNLNSVLQVYKEHSQRTNLPKIRVKPITDSLNSPQKQMQSSADPSAEGAVDYESIQQQLQQQQKEEIEKIANAQLLRNLRFFWYEITEEKWKPEAREFPTIAYNSGKLYLYGGMGSQIHNSLTTLDVQSWKWKTIETLNPLPEGRFSHSAHFYKKQMIIFGGEKKYNSHLKMRSCFNDIQLYNVQNNTWSQMRTFGEIIEGRRNHASVILNKFLFIFGGINSYNKHLNDVVSINLDTFKCNNLSVEGGDQRGVAFHAMTAVFRGDLKMDNPHQILDVRRGKDKKLQKIKEEGIYAFGGLFQNSEATNILRILKLGQKPLKWIIPETRGQPPLARSQHAMHYYDELNLVIVYGGRNENGRIHRNNVSPNGILCDVCVLDTENLHWITIEMGGMKNLFKCSFASMIIDSKIVIFGGCSDSGFENSDIFVLELDQSKNRKLLRETIFNKFQIDSAQILLNHSDLYDIGSGSGSGAEGRLQRKTSKLEELQIEGIAFEEENDRFPYIKSFQPLPKRDLRKQIQSSTLIIGLGNDKPKFKHNYEGIPTLNSVSEDEDDDQQLQDLGANQKSSRSKQGKKVNYAI